MKRWFGFALKFLLTAVLIWYLLDSIGIETTLSNLAGVSLSLVVLSIFVASFQLLISPARWQAVLRAMNARITFADAFRLNYIGTFFTQVLPGSMGGDAVRIYESSKSGMALDLAVNGVLLERLAALMGLALLTLFCLPFLYDRITGSIPLSVLLLIPGLCILGVCLMMIMDRLTARWNQWKPVRNLAGFASSARMVFLQPVSAIKVMFLSVLGSVNLAMAVWVLALSLGLNDQVGLLDCFVLVPPVLLITSLPISIAGWGVREGAMVAALGSIGVPAPSALTLSILYGIIIVVVSLPGGLVWMSTSRHQITGTQ